MKLSAVYWIISAVIVLAGICIMAAATILHFGKEEKSSLTEAFTDFDSIRIEVESCALQLQGAEDAEECTVEFVDAPGNPKAYLDGDTLVIEEKNKRPLQIFGFGWTLETGQVIITVPAQELDNLKISLGLTKENAIHDISCKSMELDCGVGTVTMRDCNVQKNADIDGGTGDLILTDIFIGGSSDIDLGTGSLIVDGFRTEKKCDIDLGTGDCEFQSCEFDELTLDCGVGDVALIGITLKGDAEIAQGTGDVDAEFLGNPEDYAVSCKSGMGDVTINGSSVTTLNHKDAEYEIHVDCGVGDVDITFPGK